MKIESVFMIAFLVVAAGTEGNEKKCECGAFKAPMPEKTNDSPLIVKAPNFPMECNLDGREICTKMCKALAEASREKAPELLCQVLGDSVKPFRPLIYSRACGDEEWTDTRLSTEDVQICCAAHSPIPCLPSSPVL